LDALDRRLYLALHRGRAGDVGFYADVCRGARSVLELGVGDARVMCSLPAPERVGVDLDPGMVELAAARCPEARFVCADMSELALEQRFERVLVPASALFALAGIEAQRRCLRVIAEHLAPGGEAWLDFYASDLFHEEADPMTDDLGRVEMELLEELDFDGEEVRVFEANQWTRESQRFDVVYWFELQGRVIEQQVVHHYLRSEQLDTLARAAGLEVFARYADFDRTPFTPDSDHLVAGLHRTPPAR
jgi:SAM-dependent methyltransferase